MSLFQLKYQRLTWGLSFVWAATMLTGNNTASVTEKWAERLISFPRCLFPVSTLSCVLIIIFSSHGRSLWLKRWQGVPHPLLLSGPWDHHRQPLRSFPLSEVFDHLWSRPALVQCSPVTWDQTAVKGVVTELREAVLEASAGSGAEFQFRPLSLVLIKPLHSPQTHLYHTKGYL